MGIHRLQLGMGLVKEVVAVAVDPHQAAQLRGVMAGYGGAGQDHQVRFDLQKLPAQGIHSPGHQAVLPGEYLPHVAAQVDHPILLHSPAVELLVALARRAHVDIET